MINLQIVSIQIRRRGRLRRFISFQQRADTNICKFAKAILDSNQEMLNLKVLRRILLCDDIRTPDPIFIWKFARLGCCINAQVIIPLGLHPSRSLEEQFPDHDVLPFRMYCFVLQKIVIMEIFPNLPDEKSTVISV